MEAIKFVKNKLLFERFNKCKTSEDYRVFSERLYNKDGIANYFGFWTKSNECYITELKKNNPDGCYLNQLDFMITEKCSLRCAECLNLMQYYDKPRNYDNDMMMHMLDIIDEVFDEVTELRILGGEPFMNPNIYDLCQYAAKKDHIKNVIIFTNATIKPTEEGIEKIDKNKSIFYISNYGVERQLVNKVSSMLKKSGIKTYVADFRNEKWIKHSEIKEILIPCEKRNELFLNCEGRICPVVSENKLYLCEFIANAEHLGAVPESDNNCIILHDNCARLKEEIKCYINSEIAPDACRFCTRLLKENNKQLVEPGVQLSKPLTYTKYV